MPVDKGGASINAICERGKRSNAKWKYKQKTIVTAWAIKQFIILVYVGLKPTAEVSCGFHVDDPDC